NSQHFAEVGIVRRTASGKRKRIWALIRAQSGRGPTERRAPVAVTVLPQVEVVTGAVQPGRQQADAAPAIEPAVERAPVRALRPGPALRQAPPGVGSQPRSIPP